MIRRLGLLVLLYVPLALLLDRLMLALVPVLVLPPLFTWLVRGLLVAGLIIGLMAAWAYRPAER